MPQDNAFDFVALVILLTTAKMIMATPAAASPVMHNCTHGLVVCLLHLTHRLRRKGVARAFGESHTLHKNAVSGLRSFSLRSSG